jgi:hypothetical protein
MRRIGQLLCGLLLLTAPLLAQGKRLWVLSAPGEMVEYDPATFAARQKIKVPTEAVQSPQSLLVNHHGQILYTTPVSLPLSEDDAAVAHKAWLWTGRAGTTAATTAATSIDQGVKREVSATGSNQAITETAPSVFLSADGEHLFWFANQARRLQRDGLDLSTATAWQAWRTDLNGAGREDLTAFKFPDCRCGTGTCEETCAYGVVWVPEGGVDKFFLMTQFVAGQTEPQYKASTRYRDAGGKWVADPMAEPFIRLLDAALDGNTIVEAIPDSGCCGWSNESNDQTMVIANGKRRTVFDEQATYKNPDYDVSFYTSNALLSPGLAYAAITIISTAQANKPIQLAEEGQANPEESQRIRKALADLPAVEVKSMEENPRRLAFVPHAVLVGWMSEKEVLIVEKHVLVVYNVATGARRRSSVQVEDAGRVFLR